jgi:hypothetical protein
MKKTYFTTKEIVRKFEYALTADKTLGRKRAFYEWNLADKQIYSTYEDLEDEEWIKEFESEGHKLKSSKSIEFEGFVLKMMIYQLKGKSVHGVDPLALVTDGYLRENKERVIFEVDLTKRASGKTSKPIGNYLILDGSETLFWPERNIK